MLNNIENKCTMRKFRIDLNDPNGYENNWDLLSFYCFLESFT